MTDTKWADVSEFQVDVNDQYPYKFLSIRSNDGTYRDHHFAHNLAWAKHAVDTGKMGGFMVYFVWEPNWRDTFNTFKAMVGTAHPKMAVMIDLESWSGRIAGNHSADINACREAVIAWLHGNRKRVIGYANAGDFSNIWPSRGDTNVVLANYGGNPNFPNKIAHQYSDKENTPPFGPCDINSADGYTLAAFLDVLGIGSPTPTPIPKPPVPAPKPHPKPGPGPAPGPAPGPKPTPKPGPGPSSDYIVKTGDTMTSIANHMGVTLTALERANPQIPNINKISAGQRVHRPGSKPAPAPIHKTYTVRNGDTMSGIAAGHHVTVAALERANPRVTNPNSIYPGQVLNLP